MAFAQVQFRLNARQADGASLREHLVSVAQQTGETPQELEEANAAICPPMLAHVWGWFLDLHRARGGAGMGPESLSYREIAAWASLTGQRLEPWELDALRALDEAWMEQAAAQLEKATRQKSTKRGKRE